MIQTHRFSTILILFTFLLLLNTLSSNNKIIVDAKEEDLFDTSNKFVDLHNKQPPTIFELFFNSLSEYFIGGNSNKNNNNNNNDILDKNAKVDKLLARISESDLSYSLSIESVLNSFNYFSNSLYKYLNGKNAVKTTTTILYNKPLFEDASNKWKYRNLKDKSQISSNNNDKLKKIELYHDEPIESIMKTTDDIKSPLCSSIGYLTFSMQDQNTCKGLATCAPQQLICDGNVINVTKTTTAIPGMNYSDCQLTQMKCNSPDQPINIFNFKDQYQLSMCSMTKFDNKNQFLAQWPIIEVLCDNNTYFGTDTFGFTCSNQQLVCGDNNTVVPPANFTQYSNQIKNGQCEIQNIPCSPTTQCLNLDMTCKNQNANCSVEVIQDLPCAIGCNAKLNVSSCECPADHYNMKCSQPTPISCNLNMISPKSMCPGENPVLTSNTCYEFDYRETANFSFELDCYFTQPVPPTNHSFVYWVDLPNFKLSNPVSWSVSNSIINFNKLFDYSHSSSTSLSQAQIMKVEPIWINTTLSTIPSDYWIAKRLYFENGLITTKSHSTLQRYFIKSNSYPLNDIPSVKLATWKIVLIVISCVFIIGCAIVATFVLYKRRYKVVG